MLKISPSLPSEFLVWVQRTKIFVEFWELTDCKVQRTVILPITKGRSFGALHLIQYFYLTTTKIQVRCTLPSV
jgi:hypothetical protein